MTGLQQARAERDQTARLNLAAFALEQDDPAGWLADMLDALGLVNRPRRDCTKPSAGTVSRHLLARQQLCGTCRPWQVAYNRDKAADRKAAQ